MELYLALFNRPAEKEGLEVWHNLADENNWDKQALADNMIKAAVNLVNTSLEYAKIYPQYYNFDIKNREKVKAVIESIYKTLFNKDYSVDPNGIDGWTDNVMKTGNIAKAVVDLNYAADAYVKLEEAGAFDEEDEVYKAVKFYENKLTVSEEFAEKINKADVNNDGVYDLQIFKDLIDEVTYTQKSVKTAEETIEELMEIEKYFQNHSSKVENISFEKTFEINGHKFPLITLSDEDFDFEAVIDDKHTIIPLVRFRDKIEPISNPYIKEDDPTDDIPADDGNDMSAVIDNSTVVDLVDF